MVVPSSSCYRLMVRTHAMLSVRQLQRHMAKYTCRTFQSHCLTMASRCSTATLIAGPLAWRRLAVSGKCGSNAIQLCHAGECGHIVGVHMNVRCPRRQQPAWPWLLQQQQQQLLVAHWRHPAYRIATRRLRALQPQLLRSSTPAQRCETLHLRLWGRHCRVSWRRSNWQPCGNRFP